MDEQYLRLIPRINADDWEQTPASVREVLKQLVLKVEQIEQLEQRLKELEIENQQLREKSIVTQRTPIVRPPQTLPTSRRPRKKSQQEKSEEVNQDTPVIVVPYIR